MVVRGRASCLNPKPYTQNPYQNYPTQQRLGSATILVSVRSEGLAQSSHCPLMYDLGFRAYGLEFRI